MGKEDVKDASYYHRQLPDSMFIFSDDNLDYRLPFHIEDDKEKFVTEYGSLFDPRIADTMELFLKCLEDQTELAEYKLVDALLARDKYLRIQESYKAGEIDKKDYAIDVVSPTTDCFRNADDTINVVSNSWEISAQLMRSFFKLNLPVRGPRMSLLNLLKHVYTDTRFTGLINHTEFSLVKDSKGKESGTYKSGSVLDRLKSYRNSSVHLLGISNESVVREMARVVADVPHLSQKSELKIYDHKSDNYILIPNFTPKELAKLAEDGYRHYAKGIEMIEDMILRELETLKKSV